ncbi:hypothetical protein KC19_5G147200 [Ceratodon purpureus]|uniref:Secreted protein n=1 Tax=Ceratodon purpureus TaxID=3225 RepID=A0A8T0I3E1_CERPU|nr:hypothetical protein KC19_5G147200 [Ceratodon purpureus]
MKLLFWLLFPNSCAHQRLRWESDCTQGDLALPVVELYFQCFKEHRPWLLGEIFQLKRCGVQFVVMLLEEVQHEIRTDLESGPHS